MKLTPDGYWVVKGMLCYPRIGTAASLDFILILTIFQTNKNVGIQTYSQTRLENCFRTWSIWTQYLQWCICWKNHPINHWISDLWHQTFNLLAKDRLIPQPALKGKEKKKVFPSTNGLRGSFFGKVNHCIDWNCNNFSKNFQISVWSIYKLNHLKD